MRIVLAEKRDGQGFTERIVEGDTIKIGRDQTNCQLVFENHWSMVSRQHAEFILNQGRCFLADLHSSFGTFVEDRRITEPTEISAGSHIQFGAGGPTLEIVSIEL